MIAAAALFAASCSDYIPADEHPNVKPAPPMEIDMDVYGGLGIAVADYARYGMSLVKAEVKACKNEDISVSFSKGPDKKITQMTALGEDKTTVSASWGTGYNITKPLAQADTILFYLPVGMYENGFEFTLTDNSGREYKLASGGNIEIGPGANTCLAPVPLTIYYGKCNCYRTAAAGNVEIDITPFYTFSYPYQHENKVVGGTPVAAASAEVVWQLTGTGIDGDVLSGDPTVSGNTLTVPVSGKLGNAVVAIKDAAGTVLWSYHVWVSEANDVEFNFPGGFGQYYMLDRHLGATSTAIKNQDSYGCFYQWGRKDPFMRPHNMERPEGNPWYTDYTAHVVEETSALVGVVAYTVRHPGVRIKSADDWHFGFRDNALWGNTKAPAASGDLYTETVMGVRTVYDPCPEGYRVSNYQPFNGLAFTSADECDDQYGHLYATGVGTNTNYFPTGGFIEKNVDSVKYLEYRGYCWTNVPGAKGAYSRGYNNAAGTRGVGLDRAVACSIRCLKVTE